MPEATERHEWTFWGWEAIEPAELADPLLRSAALEAEAAGRALELWRVTTRRDRRAADPTEVVWLPEAERVGIAWTGGGGALWISAHAPEEALREWRDEHTPAGL